MESTARSYFETKGLEAKEAWLLEAAIRSDPMPPLQRLLSLQSWTSKHLASAEKHAWLARFSAVAAKLEYRLPEEGAAAILACSESVLGERSGHANVLQKREDENRRVEELFSQGRKERSAGFMKCAKCKSTEVDVEQKQTRSADEPMTLFALCTNCGTRWTMK